MRQLLPHLLVLIVLIVLTLSGCAKGPFVPPATCVDQPSLILDTFPDPRGLDQGLLFVQLGALQGVNGYTAADAHAVIDDLRQVVEAAQDLTYAKLVWMITEKLRIANSLAGATLFIVGPDIEQLSSPLPISPCDLELVGLHLDRQDLLIDMAAKPQG